MSVAAFGTRLYANEMAFASSTAILDGARDYLNSTTRLLRTCHETVLYGASTIPATSSELHYDLGNLQPAYRASAEVETVSFVLLPADVLQTVQHHHYIAANLMDDHKLPS